MSNYSEVKKKSVRGTTITSANQVLMLFIRLGSTSILARLLTPEDYGLVAMTAVIAEFLGTFRDAGLGQATVQRKNITDAQVSNLFWINFFIGTIIFLLLLAIAPLIAIFYGDPRITGTTRGIAIAFVFSGLTIQHTALLRRAMRFSTIAVLNILAVSAGVLVAIIMAKNHFGYWSLIGMRLSTAFILAVSTWYAAKWIPQWPKRKSETMPLLKFGSDILVFNFLNYFSRKADTILIGWKWGATPLGLYDKAYNLLLLPINQINRPTSSIAISALSRIQSNTTDYRNFFTKMLTLISFCTVPMISAILIFADEIVLIWLGEGWAETATLFRLLTPAALAGALLFPVGTLLISLGKTKRYKNVGIFNSTAIVASFLAGLPYGAEGVAISYSCCMTLLLLPQWNYSVKQTPIQIHDIIHAYQPAFISSITAGSIAYTISLLSTDIAIHHSFVSAAVAVSFVSVYLFMTLKLFKLFPLIKSLYNTLRSRS